MNIFIGSSSKDSIPKNYKDDCEKYLVDLFKKNNLIFGADDTGLMGLSYYIAISNNKKITGICPKNYKDDFKRLDCTKEVIVENTMERIDKISKISDAFIFLPGGFGTLAELFCLIDSKRCHEFDKPIIIYNSNNYYDKLLEVLNKIYKENFSPEDISNMYHISNSSKDTLEYIDNYYQTTKTRQRVK